MTEKTDLSLSQLGEIFAKSGYFPDVKNASQAIVKIMSGRELGISPIVAMRDIFIIQDKLQRNHFQISAKLMAALVRRSAKYDYKINQLTNEGCEIEFFKLEKIDPGKIVSLGISKFTADDARKATTRNMDKFPRNMLFARAMSNGTSWYCPDLFLGTFYTVEELEGAEPLDEPYEPPANEELPEEVPNDEVPRELSDHDGTMLELDSDNPIAPLLERLQKAYNFFTEKGRGQEYIQILLDYLWRLSKTHVDQLSLEELAILLTTLQVAAKSRPTFTVVAEPTNEVY